MGEKISFCSGCSAGGCRNENMLLNGKSLAFNTCQACKGCGATEQLSSCNGCNGNDWHSKELSQVLVGLCLEKELIAGN